MLTILIVGGIAGGLTVLGLAMLLPLPNCPECGEKVPRFRRPTGGSQAMRGGWTCTNCGCRMDRTGRKVSDNRA